MNLTVVRVDNGSNDYPGSFAVAEQKIIKKYLKNPSLHLFSGKSTIGTVRVDFVCEEATIKNDVFDYLEQCTEYFSTIILDPPYNEKFAQKYAEIAGGGRKQFIVFADTKKTTKLFTLIKKMNPEFIIMKSWNFYIVEGYALYAGFVTYAGGYRKPCFLLIEKREGLI